jgi:hypothetical protein
MTLRPNSIRRLEIRLCEEHVTDVEECTKTVRDMVHRASRLSASADRHAMGWPNGEPRA